METSWDGWTLNAQQDPAGQRGKRGPQYKLWDQADKRVKAARDRDRALSVISGPIILASIAGPAEVPGTSHGHYSFMGRLTPELYFIFIYLFVFRLN